MGTIYTPGGQLTQYAVFVKVVIVCSSELNVQGGKLLYLIKRFEQNSGTMHHEIHKLNHMYVFFEVCFHVKEVVYKREKRGRVVPEI